MSEDSDDKYSADLLRIASLSERIPYASKAAHNFRWAKNRAQALDVQYPDKFDDEYIGRVEDNYRLMNGLPMTNYTKQAASAALASAADIQSEGIDVPNTKLEHYDFVSPFLEGLWGDQKRRKLRFTVTDSSKYTQNYIKEQKTEALRTHFETNLINPMRQYALMKWQQDNGVQDLQQLSDEQKQKMQADVTQSTESLIPVDIMNFMKTGSMGRIEQQGQAIADALAARLELKYKVDEAYRHSFATDGIVFYNGIRRGQPFIEQVDLTEFNTGGTSEMFIDNNDWFKRIKYKSPKAIWTDYSHKFTREDIKRFDEMLSSGGQKGTEQYKDDKFVTAIDFEGKVLLSQTNLLTKEGQEKYTHLLDKYVGSDIENFDNIRVAHLVWISLAKFRRITRGYQDGTIRDEYFTEDYEFNPLLGDLEEKVVWVPQYWQATKIGEGSDPIFVDVGPVPYQYRDITDPYSVRSPYTGGFLNDMMGKGYRMSPLDKVKSLIHAVNFQMKTIRDREATDIGKVILMTVAAKPKGWSWGKLIEVVRATKMLPINTQQQGLTAADVQFFRDIDLSNAYDILPRINMLMFLIQQIGNGLSSNAARQGNPAASTSVTNNSSNLNRSFSQTHGRASWVDKITEHLLENLIYYGKQSIKSGNVFMRYALDDVGIATIDIDVDELDESYFGVRVSTDDLDMDRMDYTRGIVERYLQNPNKNFSLKLAFDTIAATSRGELLNIATQAQMEDTINAAKAADAARADRQQETQLSLQMQKDILQLKNNYEMLLHQEDNAAKKEMAALNSMTIQHGNDVDGNQQNDFVEGQDKERLFKREKLYIDDARERDIEAAKLGLDQQSILMDHTAEMARIEVEKKKAAQQPNKK